MPFQLNLHEGSFLVQLARKATEVYLKEGNSIKAPEDAPRKLLGVHGVFVTINGVEGKEKQLRGCIGAPFSTTPLVQAVIESSICSATQDPRFHPLELTDIPHNAHEPLGLFGFILNCGDRLMYPGRLAVLANQPLLHGMSIHLSGE